MQSIPLHIITCLGVSLHEPWFSLCWRWFIPASSNGIPTALCWQRNGAHSLRDSADEQLLFSNWKRATESTACLTMYGVLRLRFTLLSLVLSLSLSFPFLPKWHFFPLSYNILLSTTFFLFGLFFFSPDKSISLIAINLLISHIWSSCVTSTKAQ